MVGVIEGGELVMAVPAYLSILVLIPLLVARGPRFAWGHANQGLVLMSVEMQLFEKEQVGAFEYEKTL